MHNIKIKTPLVIVSAMSKKNRVIGNNNQLLWHIPADLKRFKALTLGHPIILGEKTFSSIVKILGKPLPGRTNIVLTRDENFNFAGVKIAHSIPEALNIAETENPSEIHIGGGGKIYKQTLSLVSKLHITWIDDEIEGDTFFPDFISDFEIITRHPAQQYKNLGFQWVDYRRK